MTLDTMIKYLIWIILFGIALTGIYLLLKNMGIV